MKQNPTIKTVLIWLPSIVIAMIFIQNGIGKIWHADQMDKAIKNDFVMVGVGVILLIATLLFLYSKTIVWGTSILAFYMTFIVFIHLYKGKPFEVASLIVICTIFAAYIRSPQWFHTNK